MKYKLIIVALLFIFSFQSKAQKLTYKVKVDGKESGILTASKTGKKNNYQFSLQSKIKTSMLISIEISYELKAVFENGILKSSKLVQFVNGIKQVENSTTYQNNHYVFKDASGNEKTINETINATIPELYFSEPKNKNRIWSDNQGSFLKLSQKGNAYVLNTGDNQNSVYTYEKGICKKVEATQSFSTITFELVQ